MKLDFRMQSWACGLLTLALTAGCATQSRERAGTSSVPSSAQGNPPPMAVTEAPDETPKPAEGSESAVVQPGSPAGAPASDDSWQERASQAEPNPSLEKSKPRPSAARTRGAPRTAAPAKAKREFGEEALNPASPNGATPAFAESPELREALIAFEEQWQQLSNQRACDDACRALQSMRRAAERICELVVGDDPRERCRTARARLEQASRDLAARCTDCPP